MLMREKGQITFLIPVRSIFEGVSAKFSKAAEQKGITLENLLKDFKKTRHKKFRARGLTT